MLRDALRGFYYKIRVSRYLSRLLVLNEQFLKDNDCYLRETAGFYKELLNFIPAANQHFPFIISANPDFTNRLRYVIDGNDAVAFKSFSGEAEQFLDNLYNSLTSQIPLSKRARTGLFVTAAMVLMLLAAGTYPLLKQKYEREKEEYNLLANEGAFKEKTLQDVLVLKQALQKYFEDNHSYPKSSGGFDAVVAAFGESKQEWIPGLEPKYIDKLPVDPRRSEDSGKQYMYKSDGKDFKLIAHNPLGIEDVVKQHPELIDPVRPSWAFGVWTEGAKNW